MALELTAEDRAEITRIRGRYPDAHQAAALLPLLHYLQERFGHLAPEVQLIAAEELKVPPTRVHEVVTFYEMYHEHPEGQFHLEVCTNIACHLQGGDRLLEHFKKRLGIEVGHTTEDGMFSLMEAECIASCGSGPCMRIGEDYYESLSIEAADGLLSQLKEKAKGLNGRAYMREGPEPHVGPVKGFEPPPPREAPPVGLGPAPIPPRVSDPALGGLKPAPQKAAPAPAKTAPAKLAPPQVSPKPVPPKAPGPRVGGTATQGSTADLIQKHGLKPAAPVPPPPKKD